MSDYINCKLCDKAIKIKSKKKHLNSQYHKSLSMSITSRYSVPNPDFLHIDKILQIYVLDYSKKFAFYLIICKWKLHFSDTIVSVKSDTQYSNSNGFYLRNFLLSKIKFFEIQGRKFSHISEMNITFIPYLRNKTYEHYRNQPKYMLEWKMNAISAEIPKLIRIFGNSSHPLIRKYQHIIEDDEEN